MNLVRGNIDDMELDAAGLNTALSEATCLGIEVDPAEARLRIPLEVLTKPVDGSPVAGHRITLVLTGVGRIAASLRFHWWTILEPEQTVLPLTLDGLDEAVKTFGGGSLHGWEFIDPPESSWAKWGELLSFDTSLGGAPANHVLELSQEEGSNNRELDVRMWFSGIDVETSDDRSIHLADFISGGERWWQAHRSGDPETIKIWHVTPPL